MTSDHFINWCCFCRSPACDSRKMYLYLTVYKWCLIFKYPLLYEEYESETSAYYEYEQEKMKEKKVTALRCVLRNEQDHYIPIGWYLEEVKLVNKSLWFCVRARAAPFRVDYWKGTFSYCAHRLVPIEANGTSQSARPPMPTEREHRHVAGIFKIKLKFITQTHFCPCQNINNLPSFTGNSGQWEYQKVFRERTII